ncbi:MAG: YdjY domain-containing protein [Thermoguttaceae bacterium]
MFYPRLRKLLVLVFLGTIATCLGSQSAVGEPPGPRPKPADEESPKTRDLGSPLVEDAATLRKLNPDQPVWLDRKHGQVVMVGEVCRASYPLEFFTTLPGREYEAVTVVDVRPSIVHAGLLALGAVPGHPATFQPKFEPAAGTEIAIEVRWKDKQGKRQQARAQDWVREVKTKKPLDANWVFGGSVFYQDEQTGKKHYMADSGDFISVSNVHVATLDLPMLSSTAIESRLFEGFVERLPPPGTPVTILLIPRLKASKPVKPQAAKQ